VNPNSLVVIAVGFRLENQSYISDRHKNFFFVKEVLRFLSPGIRSENYHSPPSCSEVKNVWSCRTMTIASVTVVYVVVLNWAKVQLDFTFVLQTYTCTNLLINNATNLLFYHSLFTAVLSLNIKFLKVGQNDFATIIQSSDLCL
jgi:hypothetical protein